jgi:hypothetical protein
VTMTMTMTTSRLCGLALWDGGYEDCSFSASCFTSHRCSYLSLSRLVFDMLETASLL